MVRVRRRSVLFAVAVVAVGACGSLRAAREWLGEVPSRPVTQEEAGRLALSRLTTYEGSPVAVELSVPGGTEVRGVVDYRAHHAVGRYAAADGGQSGLVAWDADGLGVAPDEGRAPSADGIAVTTARMPPQAWSPRAYTTDPFDLALRVTMALAADRPDNAQLLAQSGARWLRDERVDGRRYTVLAGPLPRGGAADSAHLTYWVDGDGLLRRVRVEVPGVAQPVTVDLTARQVAERVPGTPWGQAG
ncbi:hypothetical protein CFP65_5885 [Kitasatospora sp. MMS16-BH015]|uniref:hypothetical protein n=1 Tax=Kitasatospora sp. MMS16-BH015 TaxID=2018025 RepID=UPI000CA15482|nr:hypothetical protein [Kitasatospora sp. MMS16-BH015]AUG80565.1 hypothetical protein CFP65_5885 [Kitasatospora sp. MMS16-BH015]